MSKLEEMIKEHCPDGVEYKTIFTLLKDKELLTVAPSIKLKRNEYYDFGKTPIISQEAEYISGYCEIEDSKLPNDEYICFGDHSEHIKYINFTFVQGADGLKIIKSNSESLCLKFVYYAASNNYIRHNNYERHFKYFIDTEIPIPPLEVQHEVVHILDNFTDLQQELTAELTARRKQYEHYRDKLLSFDDVKRNGGGGYDKKIEYKKLGEIATMSRGVRVVRGQLSENGKYPVYQNSMTPLGYYKESNCRANTVFIISAGAAGEIGYSYCNFWAADDCWYFDCPKNLESRFLYYALMCKKSYIASRVRRASVPRLSRAVIDNLQIPLPPLETQKQIVAILDKFEMLSHSLSQGLPAEIEARKKQYEYYRDLLLDFRAIGGGINY